MKWTMHDSNHFTAESEGYIIDVNVAAFCPWNIIKDGVIIDRAVYHPYAFSQFNKELQAKVSAERALDKILKTINHE